MDRETLDRYEANNKKWRDTHKHHTRYLANRTKARTFVRKYAHSEDVKDLLKIWKHRKESEKCNR